MFLIHHMILFAFHVCKALAKISLQIISNYYTYLVAHEYSPVARMHCTDPHGLKCRPGPYIELAGAMSASLGPVR